MRVFLDANVLFSASSSGSNIARLVELVIERHSAVTSDFALEEARRNVALKRPAWVAGLSALERRLEVVPSILFELPVALEEKDRPILCAAIRSGCEALVTGDRTHFGALYGTTIEGVRVVSQVELAQMLTGG